MRAFWSALVRRSNQRVRTCCQDHSNGCACGLVCVWPQVPVGVQRRRGARVPQPRLDDLHVGAAGDEQAGEVVPEVVEAEALGQALHLGPCPCGWPARAPSASTRGGLPPFGPRARAAARPAIVRSRIKRPGGHPVPPRAAGGRSVPKGGDTVWTSPTDGPRGAYSPSRSPFIIAFSSASRPRVPGGSVMP